MSPILLDLSIFTAISITGSRTVPLGERSRLRCSAPFPVESIQWLDKSNRVVREGTSVQELVLDLTITAASNSYTCRVRADGGYIRSERVTITGGKLIMRPHNYCLLGTNSLRFPMITIDDPTADSATLQLSFSRAFDPSRAETLQVMYGSSSSNLDMRTPEITVTANSQTYSYSTQLTLLEPATQYFYRIQSRNMFGTLFTDIMSFITDDDCELNFANFMQFFSPKCQVKL